MKAEKTANLERRRRRALEKDEQAKRARPEKEQAAEREQASEGEFLINQPEALQIVPQSRLPTTHHSQPSVTALSDPPPPSLSLPSATPSECSDINSLLTSLIQAQQTTNSLLHQQDLRLQQQEARGSFSLRPTRSLIARTLSRYLIF